MDWGKLLKRRVAIMEMRSYRAHFWRWGKHCRENAVKPRQKKISAAAYDGTYRIAYVDAFVPDSSVKAA